MEPSARDVSGRVCKVFVKNLPYLENGGCHLGDDLEVIGDEKDAPILHSGEETSNDLTLVCRRRPLDAEEWE